MGRIFNFLFFFFPMFLKKKILSWRVVSLQRVISKIYYIIDIYILLYIITYYIYYKRHCKEDIFRRGDLIPFVRFPRFARNDVVYYDLGITLIDIYT